jgi:glutamate--cysteine ligase
MREYLPTRGSMALDMMLRTSTVQANVDYENEDDAMRKLRVSLRTQPIVTAMFANSPFADGRSTSERSRRARVWLDMDPDRSGLLPVFWNEPGTYRRYVEWALDVPMFVVKRGKRVLRATHLRFRDFLRDGLDDVSATAGDWETHLNTLFPEARLKKTLELRGADAQSPAMLLALPALWRGLLYDDRALADAERLVEGLVYDEVERARPAIAEHGLFATLDGRELLEWAARLVAIAEAGLERLAALDARGRDERIYLAPLRDALERGETPADRLLDELGTTPTPAAVIEAIRLRATEVRASR